MACFKQRSTFVGKVGITWVRNQSEITTPREQKTKNGIQILTWTRPWIFIKGKQKTTTDHWIV